MSLLFCTNAQWLSRGHVHNHINYPACVRGNVSLFISIHLRMKCLKTVKLHKKGVQIWPKPPSTGIFLKRELVHGTQQHLLMMEVSWTLSKVTKRSLNWVLKCLSVQKTTIQHEKWSLQWWQWCCYLWIVWIGCIADNATWQAMKKDQNFNKLTCTII